MKALIKLLIVMAVLAVAAYLLVSRGSRSAGEDRTAGRGADERPRLEEKYGFTGESVGD